MPVIIGDTLFGMFTVPVTLQHVSWQTSLRQGYQSMPEHAGWFWYRSTWTFNSLCDLICLILKEQFNQRWKLWSFTVKMAPHSSSGVQVTSRWDLRGIQKHFTPSTCIQARTPASHRVHTKAFITAATVKISAFKKGEIIYFLIDQRD